MALDLSSLDFNPIQSPSPIAATAPLSAFEEDPDNPRFEFDDNDPEFIDLVEDVRIRGILQPIIVRRIDGSDILRIRFGARRYRVAVRLQLEVIPYCLTEDERQFDDYSSVAENERRKGLQPLELARFVAKKLAQGEKKKTVAEKLRIDPSAVTHLLALLDAPPFLLELYYSRKCRAPYYLYELRKLHGQNAEIVERYCAVADEIDRRMLTTIAAEIELTAQTNGLINLSNDGGGDAGSVEGNNGQIEQVPPHDQAIEKEAGGKSSGPNKIKIPLMFGTYQGREVMIVLTRLPMVGCVFIRYLDDDSNEEQVAIAQVTLTMLTGSR